MKAYTSLEQSKKLAEILPVESADIRYHTISKYNSYPCDEIVYTIYFGNPSGDDIPCWSLAALLELIPCADIVKLDTTWTCGSILSRCEADEPVNACYKMIIELHEQKLL